MLYCRLVIAILLSLSICVAIVSCGKYYYYTVDSEMRNFALGQMKFEVGNLGAVTGDTEIDSILEADTISVWLSLSIYFRDTTEDERAIDIETHSVKMRTENRDEDIFVHTLPQPTERYGGYYHTSIVPIPISKSYKADFVLQFVLTITDASTRNTLCELPIALDIIYHKERYTFFKLPYG